MSNNRNKTVQYILKEKKHVIKTFEQKKNCELFTNDHLPFPWLVNLSQLIKHKKEEMKIVGMSTVVLIL